ncbi:MAG: ComEC/Rec2 family competence protein [Patescibacteria group bacterium]
MKIQKRDVIVAVITFLVIGSIVAWQQVEKPEFLTVFFFDVGQGDSIFIETPQGNQILIDGGPNNVVTEKLGKAMPFWDKSIDLVILTHPDSDHITGLVEVLRQYRVEHILWTGVEKDTKIFAAWKRALQEEQQEGAEVMSAQTSRRIKWLKDPSSAFIEVVYPGEDDVVGALGAVNDTSVVTKLVFHEASFLFPGDISKKIEARLIGKGIDIDVDVLKVAHHGSKTSNTEAFLLATSPELAVIQVGKQNRYGHPTEEVLARFRALGIPILRTDLNGDIVVKSDGKSLKIQTANK